MESNGTILFLVRLSIYTKLSKFLDLIWFFEAKDIKLEKMVDFWTYLFSLCLVQFLNNVVPIFPQSKLF